MKLNISFFKSRILIFFISFLYINNFLVIPFNTINLQYNESSADYFSKIFSNDLYINISLGNPKQVVKSLLKMEQDQFYIYSNGYSYNKSSTYKNLNNNSESFEYFSDEKKSEDIFYFQIYKPYKEFSQKLLQSQKSINEIIAINFILIKNYQKNDFSINWTTNDKRSPLLNNYGLVGLQYNIPELNNKIFFIKSLKEAKVINNYLLSIFFNNESKINNNLEPNGYLIIGEEIFEENDNIKFINAEKRHGIIKWDIIFDEIYSSFNYLNNVENKKYINKNQQVQLIIDKPYIIGTDEYESFIYINFFEELINKGVCFKKFISINTIYFGYYCDNYSQLFIQKHFPDLYFYNKELNELFIFNKKDLFFYNNVYNKKDEHFCFFMILFTKLKYSLEKTSWSLGIPFFKKYRFYFDYDKKLIGFYNQSFNLNSKYESIVNDKNNKNYYFINIFLKSIIILGLIIFIFGFFYKKCMSKTKKNKLNVINENTYDYNINQKQDKNIYKMNSNNDYNIELVNKIDN